MKVICKVNNLNSFSDESLLRRLKKYIRMPDGEIDLQLGKEYRVYGVVFWDNSPWYYLCSEEYDEYPKPFAAECFNVCDERLSTCWTLITDEGEGGVISSLAFKEWAGQDADGRSFYERLLDDGEEEILLFKKYKKLMDEEFS